MRETEVKILEVNRAELEQKLIHIGCEFDFTKEIAAILWDDKTDSIRKAGNLLRLRKKGADNILTFKRQLSREGAKIMQEYEVNVSDFDVMRELLLQLGFAETLHLRKSRTQYHFGTIKIVFDKYHDTLSHIPEFIEIETEDLQLIYDFISLIGFEPSDCKAWGVKELVEHYADKAGF